MTHGYGYGNTGEGGFVRRLGIYGRYWMASVKHGCRRLCRRIGVDFYRCTPASDWGLQLTRALDRFDVDIVLDVGANRGQFVSQLRQSGYGGKVVSFEPLSDAHCALCSAAARDGMWDVHGRVAIGDREGEVELNVSGNSYSSSILPMLPAHEDAARNSAYVGREKAPLSPLDSIAPEYVGSGDKAFIKIDTQGFEWQVLDGAPATLKQAAGVLCELSLVELYEGQRLWREFIERLEAEGFTLWAVQKGFTDPRNGRTLQMDAVFFRVEGG